MRKKRDETAGQGGLFAAEPAATTGNSLPLRLIAVARQVERVVVRRLRTVHDLSLAEWLVLQALDQNSAASVRDLGPMTGLDAVAISRAAARLADRKLVRKTGNRDDRRLIVLTPNKAGRQLAESVARDLQQLDAPLLKGLGVQDRIRFGQMLGVIAASAAQSP